MRSVRLCGIIWSLFGGSVYEEVKIYRATDRVCIEASRGRRIGREVCRKMGISEQTFYRWKKKFAGMGVAEVRRLKQLEDENRRLKQLVADLSLD